MPTKKIEKKRSPGYATFKKHVEYKSYDKRYLDILEYREMVRKILNLRGGGMSFAEIARQMKKDPGNIKKIFYGNHKSKYININYLY